MHPRRDEPDPCRGPGRGREAGLRGPGNTASRIATFLADDDEADIGIENPAALAALAASPARVFYTEIDGKSVDPGYLYDPVTSREEQLWLFRTIGGNRFYGVVSRQFIDGAGRRARSC